MKKILILLALTCMMTSCYEDYLSDYEYPKMGFAYKGQVRTIVSDNPSTYIGVAIAGKRELDLGEWASFVVDPSLLDGKAYTLLPAEYYTLGDNNTMRARRTNISTADVQITLNQRFFSDKKSTGYNYALPLRIVGTSFKNEFYSSEPAGTTPDIMEEGQTAIIVFKYISEYSGTYYKMGTEVEITADGDEIGEEVEYDIDDLSKNITATLSTVNTRELKYTGIGSTTESVMNMTLVPVPGAKAYNVRLTGKKGIEIISQECRYLLEGDYTFYGGEEIAPQFELNYVYKSGTAYYKVKEKLVLRQRPAKDLRAEIF